MEEEDQPVSSAPHDDDIEEEVDLSEGEEEEEEGEEMMLQVIFDEEEAGGDHQHHLVAPDEGDDHDAEGGDDLAHAEDFENWENNDAMIDLSGLYPAYRDLLDSVLHPGTVDSVAQAMQRYQYTHPHNDDWKHDIVYRKVRLTSPVYSCNL